MAVVGTAEVLIRPTFTGLQRNVRKELGGLEAPAADSGRSMGTSMGKMFVANLAANVAGRAISGIFGGLANTVRGALGGGFDRLMNIEQAEIKLRTLGLNVEAVMGDVGTAVDGTKFAISDAADMASFLGASGVKAGEDMQRWLALTADAAQFSNREFADMQRTIGKVVAEGRVTGETFQELPLAAAALADHLGITQAEVRKLASAGKISADEFATAMEGTIGGAAKNAGDSFLSMRDNIKTAMNAAAANFMAPVLDAAMAVMPVVLDMTKGIRDGMKPLGEAFGAWLQPRAEAFAEALAKVPTMLGAIRDLIVGGNFTAAFREAFGVEEDHPVVGVLLTIRDTVAYVFGEIQGSIAAFAAAWRYNDGEITSSGLPGFMELVGYWARQAFDYVRETAIPAIMGLVEGFRNGEGAGGTLRGVLEFLWGVLQDIGGIVVSVATGFATFIGEMRSGEGAGGRLRDLLERVWDALLTGWQVIQDYVLPILSDLWGFIVNTLWPDLRAAFIERILPALMAVGEAVMHMWENYAQPALTALLGFVRDQLGPLLASLYEDGVKPTFDLIGKIISWTWENVIKPAFTALKDAYVSIWERAVESKDKVVGAWEAVSGAISDGWDFISGIWDTFKDGLTALGEHFGKIKNSIAGTWSALTNAVSTPIRAVVQFVNDRFLGPVYDNLAKIPGVKGHLGSRWSIPVPALPRQAGYAGGWRPGSYADGGEVGGWSPHPRADNILAQLTAGEYVLPVHATQRLRMRFGDGFLEQLRRGLPGYADGGRVGGPQGGTLGDALQGAASWVWEVFTDPAKAISGLFSKLLGGIGDSLPAKVVVGAATSAAGRVADWVRDNIFGGAEGEGGPARPVGAPLGWRALALLVRALIPGAQITSTFRPGARVAGYGNASLHSLGRAVDFVSPNMVAATRMLSALRGWTELIHTPAGMAQQQGGRPFANFLPITKANHMDHVHLGMADGGLVRPLLFDSGGYLPPGLSLVSNQTGKPEPLARTDQPGGGPQHIVGELVLRDGKAYIQGVIEDSPRQVAVAAQQGEAEMGSRIGKGVTLL